MQDKKPSTSVDKSHRQPLTNLSRRRFLAGTSALIAAPWIVPGRCLGLDGATPPSEQITVGIIGLGDRGSTHTSAFLNLPQSRIIGVCDTYKSKHEAIQKIVNTAYSGKSGEGAGCAGYQDFRELIARDDLDTVVVSAPENWHSLLMTRAVQAGKDVYGEKALTLTVAEGRMVCDAVRRYGSIFQVGTQQRSSASFRQACELAINGHLGELKNVKVGVPGGRALPNAESKPVPADLAYDLWLGPAPWTPYNDLKCTFNWYFIYDYCAGWIQSWGVHHVDTALWGAPALGKGKVKVKGSAVFPEDGIADTSITWDVNYETESGLRLSFTSNEKNEQGCRFEGTKGWVHVNRSEIRAEPESLLRVTPGPGEKRLYESSDHQVNFLECVKSRREPASPVESGHLATTATLIGDIATRTGRELVWDWSKEKFDGDEAANRMLSRPMRSPWIL